MDPLSQRLAQVPGVIPPEEIHLQGLSLRALPYERLKALPVQVSGLWLADNQLSHSPNLLQELLESFPGLSMLDLESNGLTCDHLRLLPSSEESQRQLWEQRFLERTAEGVRELSRPVERIGNRTEEEGEDRDGSQMAARRHRELHLCRGRGGDVRLSCFFCSMRVCYLDCNRLTSLPPELFTCLPNLRWLTAQRNSLTTLPSEIGLAASLEGLRLDFNQLRELPKELGRLPNLLCLSACHNNLCSLPEEMAGLQRIETLMVKGNPNLLTLPSCVQGRLANTLSEFTADTIPEAQRLPQGTFYQVDSLLNIAACRIAKIFPEIGQQNIPEELKELLRLGGRQCSQCTGVYFGDGVAQRIWEAQLCNHSVLLCGRYCSLACLHSHISTQHCSHPH